MNGAERCLNAQHDYQSFDLPPPAKIQMIADIAAMLRPVGRLQTCGFAEPIDERFGFNDITGFDIKRQIHKEAAFLLVSGGRQARVKFGLPAGTQIQAARRCSVKAIGYRKLSINPGLRGRGDWWQRARMPDAENSQPRLAGGIFIAFGLFLGAIGGVVMDQPSAGMVIGLGIGAAIAVAVWLFDRKRG